MDEYDVIVIGGGAAGENVAGRCVECGLSIAIGESELVHLLDTGHFALEEDGDLIAEKIRSFLGRHVR